MTAGAPRDRTFARVVAALDATCHDVETVAMAVDIAARFEVEVSGLFIEDVNLLRVATLPMVRHVAIGPASAAPLDMAQLEADMRAQAARAAAELEASATRQGVKWSFRVVRGLPAAELSSATMTEDLLVLGPIRSLAGLPMRVASPLQNAVRGVRRSTLHVPRRMALSRPLVVLHAGSDLKKRTLAAATRVAGADARELAVLLVRAPGETGPTADAIAATLDAAGCRGRVRQVADVTIAQLVRAVRDGGHDVLILPADLPAMADEDTFEELLRSASCDVLIVH
jgi:hypothetical protein